MIKVFHDVLDKHLYNVLILIKDLTHTHTFYQPPRAGGGFDVLRLGLLLLQHSFIERRFVDDIGYWTYKVVSSLETLLELH